MKQPEVYALIEKHFRENSGKMASRIGRYLGHKANAEDVIQEAYLRSCKYWETYDGERPFNQWFGTILNNSIKDFFKKEMLHGMGLDPLPDEPVGLLPLVTIELKEALALIAQQKENVRDILRMYLIEGHTCNEVAEVVPESASNVRKIVQRFRLEIA